MTKYYGALGHQVAMAQGTSGGASVLTYLYQDHLGSTIATTGASTSTTSYWPFGGVRSSTGTLTTDKRFTGQRYDGAIVNLHDYGARSYAQDFGWFIQPDTVVPGAGDPQTLNRYAYTVGNPLRYVDPTGRDPDVNCQTSGGTGPDRCADSYTSELGNKVEDDGTVNYGEYRHHSNGQTQFIPWKTIGRAIAELSQQAGDAVKKAVGDLTSNPCWNADSKQMCFGPSSFAPLPNGQLVAFVDIHKITDNGGEEEEGVGRSTAVGEEGDSYAFAGGTGTNRSAIGGTVERHHLLPREFEKQFKKADLEIEDFTVDLSKEKHRLKPEGIHTGSENWNKQWRDFFRASPNAEKDEILEQLAKMVRSFGI